MASAGQALSSVGAAVGLTPNRVKLPIQNKRLEDLIMWRDPKATAAVVAGVTVAYLVLGWSGYSLLRLSLNFCALVLFVCFLWANLGGVVSRPGPPLPDWLLHGVKEVDLTTLVDKYYPQINNSLKFVGKVLSAKDTLLTGQVLGGFVVASFISGILSLISLLYIAFVVVFSVPVLYEYKKDEADKLINSIKSHATTAYSKLDEAVLRKIPKPEPATPKQD